MQERSQPTFGGEFCVTDSSWDLLGSQRSFFRGTVTWSNFLAPQMIRAASFWSALDPHQMQAFFWVNKRMFVCLSSGGGSRGIQKYQSTLKWQRTLLFVPLYSLIHVSASYIRHNNALPQVMANTIPKIIPPFTLNGYDFFSITLWRELFPLSCTVDSLLSDTSIRRTPL